MTLEAQIDALQISVTELILAINVKKVDLDAAVAATATVPADSLAAQQAAIASQAWATGTLPGGAGTKSAREWAESIPQIVGPGVPVGGVAGQILVKQSSTDFDSAWQTLGSQLVTLGNGLTVSGNVTIDGTTFFVDSVNNRVGIGKTNPATTLDVTGSIYASSVIRNTGGGSAATPSIQPGNDADTGMFLAGTNIIGFSAAGAERMRISSTSVDITNDLSIADKIIHSGDTDTAIRFPAADTVSIETFGLERVRVTSTGAWGLAGANYGTSGQVLTSNGSGSPPTWQDAGGGGVDPGAIMGFAQSVPPTGWLKANGAAVSRTTYAALFAAIGTTYGAGDGSTTFNLPDYRGEFMRGWDDGRGVDSGRALGSAQSSQNLSHTHSVSGSTSTDGSHSHAQTLYSSGSGITGPIAASQPFYTSAAAGVPTQPAGSHAHSISGTAAASGGTEARPRNIAALICIKF